MQINLQKMQKIDQFIKNKIKSDNLNESSVGHFFVYKNFLQRYYLKENFKREEAMSYKNELEKYAHENEDVFNAIFRQDFQANFEQFEHKMLIERETLDKVYEDLSCLEKTDLEDFMHKEKNDRPNKKRRNLLR